MKRVPRGFTLLEIIVTIIIFGIMAAMLAPYFGTGFIDSYAPIKRLKDNNDLSAVMANMVADYENALDVGQRPYTDELTALQTRINNNPGNMYGTYTVVDNLFLTLPPPNHITIPPLKVTITNGSGDKISYLFTDRKP